jgi:hypothetical protein
MFVLLQLMVRSYSPQIIGYQFTGIAQERAGVNFAFARPENL